MRKSGKVLIVTLIASMLLTGCGLTDAMANIVADKLQESLGVNEDSEQITDSTDPDVAPAEPADTGSEADVADGADETVVDDVEVPAPGPDPELVVFKKYYYEMSDDDNYNILLNAQIEVPGVSDESAGEYPELEESMRTYSFNTLDSFTAEVESSTEDAKDFYEEMGDPDNWNYGFELTRGVNVKRADSQVVSFFFPIVSYQGGAHGMYGNDCVTFDTVTGKELMVKDVLNVSSSEELNDMLADLLKKKYPDVFESTDLSEYLIHYSIDKDPDDTSDMYSEDYTWAYTWALNNEGIEFYFGPYALASYAAGDQSVVIRYDDHPEMFADKYIPVEREGGFIDHFGRYTADYDLDGDGEGDSIGIDPIMNDDYTEYVNAWVYVNDTKLTVGEGDYDLPFPEEAEGYYVHTADGRDYLYLLCATYSDFYDLYVYDISGARIKEVGYKCFPSFYIDHDIVSDISRSFFLYDPDNMKIADRFDVITTFSAFKNYHVGPDGMPETDDEVYTVYNTGGWEPITVIKDFEATYINDDGEEEPYPIEKGETFEYVSTDGETYVDTVISDGTPIRLYYEREDYELSICGYPAEEIFKELMYSG